LISVEESNDIESFNESMDYIEAVIAEVERKASLLVAFYEAEVKGGRD